MSSIDIFVENLNRIGERNNLKTYREMAEYLNVTEDIIKHWQNKSREPTLKMLDKIGDRLKCPSCLLLQKNGEIFGNADPVKNDSRSALLFNLNQCFKERGRQTWRDKTALFFNFVSEDALKSYFRKSGYKTPPLRKLDDMAEALGKPVYELIRMEESYEKTDT